MAKSAQAELCGKSGGAQRNRVAGATIFLLLAAFAVPAAASITYHFNDLGADCSPSIPNSYHGLTWSSDFQIECNADYLSSYNNTYGASSGYAATNGSLSSGLSEISIATGTFDILGAALSSFAGSDNFQAFSALSLQIYAYRPGDAPDSPTFVATIDLDPTQYLTTTLNWTGITGVFFAPGNGPASDPNTIFGVDGLSWLMTDLEVDAVPEPASGMLIGAGLTVVLCASRISHRFFQKTKGKL